MYYITYKKCTLYSIYCVLYSRHFVSISLWTHPVSLSPAENVPVELRDPFYCDQYEQEHLKPPVTRLLLSPELYCRTYGLLLGGSPGAEGPPKDMPALLQVLGRKGLAPKGQNAPVTEAELRQKPIKMVSRLSGVSTFLAELCTELSLELIQWLVYLNTQNWLVVCRWIEIQSSSDWFEMLFIDGRFSWHSCVLPWALLIWTTPETRLFIMVNPYACKIKIRYSSRCTFSFVMLYTIKIQIYTKHINILYQIQFQLQQKTIVIIQLNLGQCWLC